MDGFHVAAPDVRQNRADGHQVGRHGDVDGVPLQQIHIAGAVDDGDNAFRTEAFGQHAGHDVVFVVVGERAEHVDFVDVFAFEQAFVGGGAVQHQGAVEVFRKPFGAFFVDFDDFHIEAVFQLAAEAEADLAAAGNHHAPRGLLLRAQFAQHFGHLQSGGGHEYFIALLNHGLRRGHNQLVVAVDGADLAVGAFGQVFVDGVDGLPQQPPAALRAHHEHAHFIFSKSEHLQGAGVAEQIGQPLGNQLFGADGFAHAEQIERAAAVVIFFGVGAGELQIIGKAHAGDAVGDVEQAGSQFAGSQIGFVVAGEGEQQVGVVGAAFGHHGGRRAVAQQGLHIELAADVAQGFGVVIDNGNVVVGDFHQILCHGGAHLAAT